MDHRFDATLDAPPSAVYPYVADLESYPRWLDVVDRVEPDGEDGWLVTLRARLGPLARSKRLRMACTVDDPDRHVRFERAERDGRDHAPWILAATLAPHGPNAAATTLTMQLTYGGRLWSSALGGILDAQVASATSTLEGLVGSGEG